MDGTEEQKFGKTRLQNRGGNRPGWRSSVHPLCSAAAVTGALRRRPLFRVLSPNSCMTDKVFERAKRLDEEYSAPEYDENGSGEDMDSTTLTNQTFLRSVLVS